MIALFSGLVLLCTLSFLHKKMKSWLVATSSPVPLHLFPSAFDGKYTPLAFSKVIPGLGIMNSGLLSLGKEIYFSRLLPSRNTGQKTEAAAEVTMLLCYNLASKASCEARDTKKTHLTGWQDFHFKFSVTVRGILSPPPSPHLTCTK